MKFMYKNKWFSIVLALGVVLVLTSISIYLLEYIVPFSKNVKGLDNYTKAYYQSWRGIEESLYFLSSANLGSELSQNFTTNPISYSFQTFSSWSVVPESWKWESNFDKDWGILWQNTPVHIYLPNSVNWINTKIYIRVPNFDGNSGTDESLDALLATEDVVNWQLASKSEVLNSVSIGSRFIWGDICHSNVSCTSKDISSLNWVLLDGTTTDTFWHFFSMKCSPNFSCILKLSLVNKLLWQSSGVSWKKIPYLEYKINFDSVYVPYNRVLINTSGKSYGFRKDFSFDFPLKMLNEAFDFTVFQ